MPKAFTLLPLAFLLASKYYKRRLTLSLLTNSTSLSQQASDETLQSEVKKVFSKFGEVFVKIRRDNRNMPFAFCQFTVSNPA